jgi:hypothetical protein
MCQGKLLFFSGKAKTPLGGSYIKVIFSHPPRTNTEEKAPKKGVFFLNFGTVLANSPVSLSLSFQYLSYHLLIFRCDLGQNRIARGILQKVFIPERSTRLDCQR